MRHTKLITLALIGIVALGGTAPVLAVQPQLQQQDDTTGCGAQACIDSLQPAPGLPSQPQTTPLQSAPSTSPQSGAPLQPAGNNLGVIGEDAFEPESSFDTSLLWLAIGLTIPGLALAVLARMLYVQAKKPNENQDKASLH